MQVDAGRHQYVARLHIGRRGHEAELRRAAGPGTDQQRANAAALDLHRDRVILLGQQRDLGDGGKRPRHLADDADVVDDGLARPDLVVCSLVDEYLLAERIAAEIQHLGKHLIAVTQ